MENFCTCCGSLSNCGNNFSVIVPDNVTLKTRTVYDEQWHFYHTYDRSDRGLVDDIVNILMQYGCANLYYPDGTVYEIPEYDEILPQDERCTWVRRYRERHEEQFDNGILEPHYIYTEPSYKDKYLPLLRLMHVAMSLMLTEKHK